MKEIVESLIQGVKKESQQIIDYCQKRNCHYKSKTFDSPCVIFASVSEHELKEATEKLRAKCGVYIFVMNTDLDISKKQILEWNKVRGGLINVVGNIHDIPTKASDCFYIGSCYHNSLMTRIREHFSVENVTASLKLNNVSRSWIKNSLIIYCFPINKTFIEEEKRIILPAIEKELHNKLKAIAGSSRV